MLTDGSKLSHFEIVEKLGQGGMGVVYKARDLRLNRLVALKVLPPAAVSDPARQSRFQQEAQAASALNHPNIVTIYEIDSAGDVVFIAMEYVDGRTLDKLIPPKGLRYSEALQYAVQIAGALAAAHAAGIVHRDIKPANVMIAGKGAVKVLDFGLAKLTEPSTPRGIAEDQPTLTMQKSVSEEGTVAGTAAYMSPEQAEAKKLDGRSDIFSLGVVLYEMLTGRRAFRGDTNVATMAAILSQEPKPAHEIVEALPPELDRVLTRCLRKDPDRRFQHMVDLKVALEELKEESDSRRLGGVAAPPRRRSRTLFAALAVGTGLALAAITWMLETPGKPSPPQTIVPLTAYTGSELFPTFSPDGAQVAFSWDGEKEDNFDIYIKQVDGGTPVRLTTDPANDSRPAWSPDGRTIAFVRSLERTQAIILIPSIGGPERKLLEITGRSVAWSPDSKWLAFGDGDPRSLYLLSVATGERRRLTSGAGGSEGDDEPAFSQDGRRLAYRRSSSAASGDIFALPLAADFQPAGVPAQLSRALLPSGLAWTPAGELVFGTFGANTTLRLLRMPAVPGATPSLVLSENGSSPAISRQGNRLAYSHQVTDFNIWRGPVQGGNEAAPPVALIASTLTDTAGRYSPDGKRIVFASDRSGRPEIWIANADGTSPIQVASLDGQQVGSPCWSPDGETIAFDGYGVGNWDVYLVPVSGGKAKALTTTSANDSCPIYSRDGKWIYFASNRTGRFEIWKAPPQGGAATQVTKNGGRFAMESPDGTWLYFMKSKDEFSGPLLKMPTAGGPETPILPTVFHRGFAPAAKGVYYRAGGRTRLLHPFSRRDNGCHASGAAAHQVPVSLPRRLSGRAVRVMDASRSMGQRPEVDREFQVIHRPLAPPTPP
jgi:serine/threonine protein kinase/Tol biopolymer transport system component